MKTFVFILYLCLQFYSVNAQTFDDISFNNLPQDYQLYPRNAQNKGTVLISGTVSNTTWSYLSVQVFRNNVFLKYTKLPITNSSNSRVFSSSILIQAEKAEFSFRVYKCNMTDSVMVVNRQNVVSGDVYVLTGQSNATCVFNEFRTNEFCRTFGKITGTFNTENYNPADTLWSLSNQSIPSTNVGVLGFEIQQRITDNYNIPTCLINAGFNWSSAAQHANRNPNNPTDLNTGYGRMLYRLQKGGVVNQVKALIYRQGETEAYGEGADFIGNFTQYYNYVNSDLLNLGKLYVFQIDIINYARPNIAPVVRDDQRKLEINYPNIQVIPSIGTTGFDGLHYPTAGYTQNALETVRLIGRDFYNSTDTDNINSPNIRRVFYSKTNKKEITLEFEPGQDLSWQAQHRGQQIINFFYLDGLAGNVESGVVSGRRVVLQLYNPSTATKLSYLPTYVPETESYYPYTGPYILNRRGMRAFSFYQVDIENPPVCLTTNSCCSTNESLMSGNWTEPSLWSCNHVPNNSDNVIIRSGHIIYAGLGVNNVKSLRNQGILKFITTSTLRVNFP